MNAALHLIGKHSVNVPLAFNTRQSRECGGNYVHAEMCFALRPSPGMAVMLGALVFDHKLRGRESGVKLYAYVIGNAHFPCV
jgi:hypothetical protein